jgi:hypothetical protein
MLIAARRKNCARIEYPRHVAAKQPVIFRWRNNKEENIGDAYLAATTFNFKLRAEIVKNLREKTS